MTDDIADDLSAMNNDPVLQQYLRDQDDPADRCPSCGALYDGKGRYGYIHCDVCVERFYHGVPRELKGDGKITDKDWDDLAALADAETNERDKISPAAGRLMVRLHMMTPRERFQTLVDAGICDDHGNLTEPYRDDE